MGIPLKRLPRSVSGNGRNLGDGSAHFEEAGNCPMSEVVKVKISYAQNLARASESGSYGVRGVRKNAPLLARHCINDLHRLRRQLTPHVVI